MLFEIKSLFLLSFSGKPYTYLEENTHFSTIRIISSKKKKRYLWITLFLFTEFWFLFIGGVGFFNWYLDRFYGFYFKCTKLMWVNDLLTAFGTPMECFTQYKYRTPALCNLDRIFPTDFICAGFHPHT